MAADACVKIVFCTRVYALVFALCAGAGVEKAGIFYKGFTALFAVNCTIWHYDTFANFVIPLCMAFLSDAAACLYRYLQKPGAVKILSDKSAETHCEVG